MEAPDQAAEPSDTVAALSEPATTLGPAIPPGNARLRYTVLAKAKGMDYRASGEMNWEVSGQGYRAEMEVGAFLLGSRKQISQGQVSPEGLVPQRFDDISRRERRTEFDQATGEVRYQRNGRQEALRAGNQDQLSVAIQLAALAKAQPERFREGEFITLPVSDTRRTSVWQFKVLSGARINTGAGEFEVIRLHRLSTDSKEKSVTIDLAPALDHMPVRIRLDEANGDFLEQTLDSVEQ